MGNSRFFVMVRRARGGVTQLEIASSLGLARARG
jgi:hypothetical protein